MLVFADLYRHFQGVVVDLDGNASSGGGNWVTRNFGRFRKVRLDSLHKSLSTHTCPTPQGDLCSLVVQGQWPPMALMRWKVSHDELEIQGLQVS